MKAGAVGGEDPMESVQVHPGFGYQGRESGDVATQPLNLIALVGSGGHPGMETEAGQFSHTCRARWQVRLRGNGLQAEHLAALL